MAISNILDKIKKDPETPPKFLALELTDEAVQAAVWHVAGGRTEVTTVGIPVEWDGKDEKELINAVDGTISNAIEGLEEEPDQVIFGVTSSWANKTGITDAKLSLIKKICKELEFKPLGFVVIGDSIIRYLKMQEGTPTSSILIQVSHDEIMVSLIRLGVVEGVQTVGRSEDIALDVEEAISRFPGDDNLPSRIILYNSMHNMEDIVQNLVSYDWKSKFNFLHIPRVESLPKDVAIRAIAVAGGSEVAKSIGFDIKEPVVTPPKEEEIEEQPPKSQESKREIVEPSEQVSESTLLTAEEFGFGTIGSDQEGTVSTPPKKISLDTPTPSKEEPQPKQSEFTNKKMPKISLPSFSKSKIKLPSIKNPFSNLNLGNSSLSKSLVIGGASIVTLIVLFFVGSWYIPRATVTISVEPKTLEETLSFTLSPDSTTIDAEQNLVPASIITQEEQGDSVVETTGEKTIGDPATGEVVIYNRTSQPKTFESGTTLTSNSIEFTLDESVTVASKSAGSDYVDVPGKETAKITASQIGEEGNLGEGSEFSIASFSKDNYVGKNESALSGGTSETVKVVGKSDMSDLLNSLTDQLESQARTDLEAHSGEGKGIYILTDSAEITDSSYSAEVGDVEDSLSGTISLEIKAIVYNTQDVEDLVASALNRAIPQGYTRTIAPPRVEIQNATQQDDNSIDADAKVIVELLPVIDQGMVQKSLKGLSASKISDPLSAIGGFSTADVVIEPSWLPTRWKRMPKNPENITVRVKST